MVDELFRYDEFELIYVSIWISMALFLLVYLIIDGKRVGEKYSSAFLRVWKLTTVLLWFFVTLAGTQKRIVMSYDAEPLIGIGEAIGTVIGLYFFGWLLTYVIMFTYKIFKPIAKKIHDITNED